MQKQRFNNQSPWRVVVSNSVLGTWSARSFRRRETAERYFEARKCHHRLGDWAELELRSGNRWVRAQLRRAS
jgi:hypothetical protein